ncbi:MAG: trimethylamine methyltransferase family protein [Verrucomicrobia bacterium]|nr:trimethylamine methyltransferase family protein [Verrucomicrobiota bacterium]
MEMSNRSPFLKLLSDDELRRIHSATLDLMENTGIKFSEAEAQKIFRDAGLPIDSQGVVRFKPHVVEQAIRTTPPRFTRYPISPQAQSVKMGDGRFHMSPGSTVLNVLDVGAENKRPGTLDDIIDFARMGDALPHFLLGNGVVWAQDVDPKVFHAVYFEALVKNCGKPTPGGDILSPRIGEDLMLLSEIVLGSKEAMRQKKTYAFSGCPANALFWGETVQAFLYAARHGMPSNILPTPFAGSVCPVTLAGTLVQANAEILSVVTLIQLLNPGAPVIYAPYCGIMDMRTGHHSWGCPEAALLSAAVAQICRHYRMPCDTIAGASDSKVPDGQAAYEKMMVVLMPALAGSDSCTLFGGLLELDDFASYEQLVIDNEIAGNILRILQGIRVDDERMALDVIASIGPGGNFLSHEHTLKHFREEHYVSCLADRRTRSAWEAGGAKDLRRRAADSARKILETHVPSHIAEDTQNELEQAVRSICKREGVEYRPIRIGPRR